MIDEVHLLREQRGSVLEVVVARTRRYAPAARMVAVSATVSLGGVTADAGAQYCRHFLLARLSSEPR